MGYLKDWSDGHSTGTGTSAGARQGAEARRRGIEEMAEADLGAQEAALGRLLALPLLPLRPFWRGFRLLGRLVGGPAALAYGLMVGAEATALVQFWDWDILRALRTGMAWWEYGALALTVVLLPFVLVANFVGGWRCGTACIVAHAVGAAAVYGVAPLVEAVSPVLLPSAVVGAAMLYAGLVHRLAVGRGAAAWIGGGAAVAAGLAAATHVLGDALGVLPAALGDDSFVGYLVPALPPSILAGAAAVCGLVVGLLLRPVPKSGPEERRGGGLTVHAPVPDGRRGDVHYGPLDD